MVDASKVLHMTLFLSLLLYSKPHQNHYHSFLGPFLITSKQDTRMSKEGKEDFNILKIKITSDLQEMVGRQSPYIRSRSARRTNATLGHTSNLLVGLLVQL